MNRKSYKKKCILYTIFHTAHKLLSSTLISVGDDIKERKTREQERRRAKSTVDTIRLSFQLSFLLCICVNNNDVLSLIFGFIYASNILFIFLLISRLMKKGKEKTSPGYYFRFSILTILR